MTEIQENTRQCPRCKAGNPVGTRFCGACGTHLDSGVNPRTQLDPIIGTLVGNRFVVIEKIAQGGMGIVYRAEQTGIWRQVALKVLRPRYSQDKTLHERFRIEASTASRLSHPNTITIYDFGFTADGGLYIAMEMLDGVNLDSEIKRVGLLNWKRAARIALQICHSLQEAHDYNIIHRDMKPENIMLTSRGTETDVVKVLDFGIAKIMIQSGDTSQPALTAGNELFGTPEYMSPEQIRGDTLDARTDIYSLGVIMYRMLSGTQPFEAATPIAVLTKHLTQTPPPLPTPKTERPIPAPLELLTMSCLSKEPTDRPESMSYIAHRLLYVLDETVPVVTTSNSNSQEQRPKSPAAPPTVKAESSQKQVAAAPVRPLDRAKAPSDIGLLQTTRHVPVSEPDEDTELWEDELEDDYKSAEDASLDSIDDSEPLSKREATIKTLLEKMKKQRDFPAMSHNVVELTTKAQRDDTSAGQLSNVILKDYALTSKLLRLINSPFYGQYRGRVMTISRAVVIMGFEQVRQLAFGLMMFEKLEETNPKHAKMLREEALSSLMSGILAKKLADKAPGVNGEEALVCGMFHRLGKYIATLYFPQKSREIKRLVIKNKTDEQTAALKILGISYPDLGKLIAKEWDLPSQFRQAMTPLDKGQVSKSNNQQEKMRQAVCFADELVNLSQSSHRGNRKTALKTLARRFSKALPTSNEDLDATMMEATEEIRDYTKLLSVSLRESKFIGRLLHWNGISDNRFPTGEDRLSDIYDVVSPMEQPPDAQTEKGATFRQQQEILVRGIEEISLAMTSHYDLSSLILMIIETMYRGLGLARVVFFLNDIKSGVMVARSGFGDDVEILIRQFRFQPRRGRDLFNQAAWKRKDIIVNDTSAPRIAERIPAWYRRVTHAEALLLYPVILRNVAAGLFYGDILNPSQRVNHGLLVHMDRLRNLAARAIREKGTNG